MKVRAVDFVCYMVKDYKKSLKFYRDILGLKLTEEFGGSFAEFDLGNVTLAIGSAAAMNEKMGKPMGNASVGISVENVAKEAERLRKKGVKVSKEVHDFPGCNMVEFQDPDGNKIFLHHRKDGTAG